MGEVGGEEIDNDEAGCQPESYHTSTTEALSNALDNYQRLLMANAQDAQFQRGGNTLTDSDVRDAVRKIGYSKKPSKWRVFAADACIWVGGAVAGIAFCAVFNFDDHGAAVDATGRVFRENIAWPTTAMYLLVGIIFFVFGWYAREHD